MDWAAIGTTPLHMAVLGDRTSCVRLLCEAGAALEQPDHGGATPLYVAAAMGRAECMRVLLDAGAAVNHAAMDGTTPLSVAAARGHTKCVWLLYEAGAVGDHATMQRLMEAGVLPEGRDSMQEARLDALRRSDATALARMLPLGVYIDARHETEKQDTLLTWAARHGQAGMVRLLLDRGAAVGATAGGGATPLWFAAKTGHTECTRLLYSCCARRGQSSIEAPAREPRRLNEATTISVKPPARRCARSVLWRRCCACVLAMSGVSLGRRGHCGVTTNAPFNCDSDDMGSFSGVSVRRDTTWQDLAKSCLQLCAACARCRHVSVNETTNTHRILAARQS